MNLPKRDCAHFARLQGSKEVLPIFENTIASVPVGEAEIQNLLGGLTAVAIGLQFACAIRTRAESVHEPIELSKLGSFQNLQSTRLPQNPRFSFVGTLTRRRLFFGHSRSHSLTASEAKYRDQSNYRIIAVPSR